MLEIKPISVPFCNCPKCRNTFKKCAERPSSLSPTIAAGDVCKFCRKYVFWKSNLVPNCNHQEVKLLKLWGKVTYAKVQQKVDGAFVDTEEYDLTKIIPPKGQTVPEYSYEPVRTLAPSKPNTCKDCGELVVWLAPPK